jgi:hypothetical protein
MNLNSLLKDVKNHDLILGIVLIIYIFGGFETPYQMAPYIDNFMGYVIMLVIFGISLRNSHLVVAILLGFGFVTLLKRSQDAHPVNVMPSQNYRDTVMNSLNQGNQFNSYNQPLTAMSAGNTSSQLEETMVAKMSTLEYRDDETTDPVTFKPTMSNNCNAFELQQNL